jgi:hypothetical protein
VTERVLAAGARYIGARVRVHMRELCGLALVCILLYFFLFNL